MVTSGRHGRGESGPGGVWGKGGIRESGASVGCEHAYSELGDRRGKLGLHVGVAGVDRTKRCRGL